MIRPDPVEELAALTAADRRIGLALCAVVAAASLLVLAQALGLSPG